MKIFKYTITPADHFELELPIGAQILTVQTQYGVPCIWCLVNPNLSTEIRRFRMAGTGHPINEDFTLIYIGTFQMSGGQLIFHLFEMT